MSSRPPTTTQHNEGSIYFPTRVGQRYGMTAETQLPPSAPHTLPPPLTLAARPHLPPPAHLEPSFVPQSPQVRPPYSDFPTRHQYAPAPHFRQPAYEQALSQDFSPSTQASAPSERPTYSTGYPHPPLYPQKVSYQSANPGTLYEAISPVEYGAHDTPPGASLFNEGGYSTNPYSTGLQQPHPSPAGSYHSSATSSSGFATGPMQFPRPAQALETQRKSRDITDRYILTIRQQPIAARACGFGERDRRVIDPPPIVQLSLKDFDAQSPSDLEALRWPFNILHCSLLSVPPQSSVYSSTPDVTQVPDPNQSNRWSRRLMGTLVASPFVGIDPEAPGSSDENARLSCFFVFPDLSCRQNGLYRLRFTLMKVNMPNMSEDGQGSIAGSVDSDTFEVFSAKDFPGMRASTTLTRKLKEQGATVQVKKGKSQRKRGGSVGDRSSDDDSDGGEEAPKSRQRKKRG
ncbi:hypothetical protein OEA41_008323 [Lepraria neglecta]|uniref:Velvet domain-containing protein n=1 Tax=Lepraria neglecta TaxID=209136 RepID=A0AAE0DP14_9LECA|nr:hypothetical protein OEA41_008323 [Lepraria neglecta]